MTDDMDELLRADAQRWQAAQPAPPRPDLARLAAARPPGRWQPLAAAAAVVLLAGGAVVAATTLGGPDGSGTNRPDVAPVAVALKPRPALRTLLVRDGDRVAGTGQVLALPGRPVRFCAPVPVALPGYVGVRVPAYCDTGVNLAGANLSRLTERFAKNGAVWGQAWIEGSYRSGTLIVTAQGAPRRSTGDLPVSFPDRPPCPAPEGGWAPGQLDGAGAGADPLVGYLNAHPDQFGELVVTYPDGPPTGATDGPDYNKTQVALVGTTADPNAIARSLRKVYSGNLCVTRVPRNRLQVNAVQDRVPRPDREHMQIYTIGTDYYGGLVTVQLVIVDQQQYEVLTAADRGTGIVAAQPWLTRVG
ncbi:MAG TPA: hypothetical protein VMU51_36805 [Mycobacteriales bacterium]|nr:hypothetical protein [Mycobacteriales bacterium]